MIAEVVYRRSIGSRFAVRVAVFCAAVVVAVAAFPRGAKAEVAVIQVRVVGAGTVDGVGSPFCPPACRLVVMSSPSLPIDGFGDFLTAIPAAGASFAGWTIDQNDLGATFVFCGSAPVCFFSFSFVDRFDHTITKFLNLTATFVAAPPVVPEPGGATTVVAPPPVVRDPDGAFLCYSRFQVDPGVWPEKEAAALLANGYWRPTAVPGAVSATRLGPYSLVCNPPNVARVIDRGFVDDGGVALADVGDPWLGLYPLAG